MDKSETLKELATALSKAQAEMPAAPFNSTNPFFKSKYADLGSIIKTAQPVLARHGLSVSQHPVGGDGNLGVCTILMHTSGEYLESTVFLPMGDEQGKNIAQAAGSVFSYLRRYSLAAVLGMYTDEDTDANTTTQPEKKPAQVQAPAPQKSSNGSGDKFPVETVAAAIKAGIVPDANYANDALRRCSVPKDADLEIVGRWLKAYQGYIDQGETAAKAAETANKGYQSWLAKQQA